MPHRTFVVKITPHGKTSIKIRRDKTTYLYKFENIPPPSRAYFDVYLTDPVHWMVQGRQNDPKRKINILFGRSKADAVAVELPTRAVARFDRSFCRSLSSSILVIRFEYLFWLLALVARFRQFSFSLYFVDLHSRIWLRYRASIFTSAFTLYFHSLSSIVSAACLFHLPAPPAPRWFLHV